MIFTEGPCAKDYEYVPFIPTYSRIFSNKSQTKTALEIAENFDCPYCREEDAIDLIDSDKEGRNFVYVHPEGYLYCLHYEGLIKQPINYCPMCGRKF